MADKYIKQVSGSLQEEEVIIITAGSTDSGKILGLDSTGLIDPSFMPPGSGPDLASIVTSENLSAGNFVNIWNDGGTIKVRKADATDSSKEANGFVLDGATSGASVNVYFEGRNTQLSGLTGGTIYFLSATTPGAVSATSPTTTDYIVQKLGKAYTATAMTTEISQPITLA